jgi:hypothetical protein
VVISTLNSAIQGEMMRKCPKCSQMTLLYFRSASGMIGEMCTRLECKHIQDPCLDHSINNDEGWSDEEIKKATIDFLKADKAQMWQS